MLVGRQIVAVPALIVLGLWIVLQIFAGAGSIAQTTQTSDTGGVAYMAHVGGFVAGLVLTFRPRYIWLTFAAISSSLVALAILRC